MAFAQARQAFPMVLTFWKTLFIFLHAVKPMAQIASWSLPKLSIWVFFIGFKYIGCLLCYIYKMANNLTSTVFYLNGQFYNMKLRFINRLRHLHRGVQRRKFFKCLFFSHGDSQVRGTKFFIKSNTFRMIRILLDMRPKRGVFSHIIRENKKGK